MFFQQFIGCNSMIYYAPTFFGSTGSAWQYDFSSGDWSVWNCELFQHISCSLFDRLTGKTSFTPGGCYWWHYLAGSGWSSDCQAWIFSFRPQVGWIGRNCFYLYLCYQLFLFMAPIGWVLPSEIFSLGIRSKAIAITTSSTWMNNFIIGLVSPKMIQNITWGTYVIFAGFALIALLFT